MRSALLFMLGACSGSPEPVVSGGEPAESLLEAPALPGRSRRSALSSDDLADYGARVFNAPGSNTCADCHGADGKSGRLGSAADLSQPSTWKVNAATAGSDVASKTALVYLISQGARSFNERFTTDKPDTAWAWENVGDQRYDVQMFGVVQSSTMAELKKIRKALKLRGVEISRADLPEFGARAALAHVETLRAKPAP